MAENESLASQLIRALQKRPGPRAHKPFRPPTSPSTWGMGQVNVPAIMPPPHSRGRTDRHRLLHKEDMEAEGD